MITLSTRAKEAIKTGLAMAIAYGIALAMDWDNPKWAGFAVAMISLTTAGQSLNKGAMRMFGTLVAAMVALALIAVFPQERWGFMVLLSLWIGFCTYQLTGKKRQYFWFASGFVCLIVAVAADPPSESAFQIAVARSLETGLGVLVYSVVTVLLWKQSGADALNQVAGTLLATQAQVFRAYRDLLAGKDVEAQGAPLRMEEVRLAGQLGPALDAAEADSYEVWEVRAQWRRLRDLSIVFAETLERWRESFPEIRPLDLAMLFPNLDAVCSEVERRLSGIGDMMGGNDPVDRPHSITVTLDETALGALNHFQKAAVILTRAQIEGLERISRSLFETVADIKGHDLAAAEPHGESGRRIVIAFDLEKFLAVIRVLATLWIAFLIWIYVDPPGHASFVQMAGTFAMIGAMMPQISVSVMFLPFAIGSLVTGLLYVFVMPQLSGYGELGLLVFGVTFVGYYVFSEPRQALARLGCIVPFIAFTGINNEQAYSFAGYANSVAMLLLVILLVAAIAYVPTSPRPEKAFLRLFTRFFRHADHLMARLALDWEQSKGIKGRLGTALYAGDLLTVPATMRTWGRFIDHRTFPENSPELVQALVTSLDALAYRIKELVEAREHPQAELLVREMLDDLRGWRFVIQTFFREWSRNPGSDSGGDLKGRLDSRLEAMEKRITETLGLADAGELGEEDYRNFYRLLGAFRGLSEAVIAHARIAAGINWAHWQESRF